MQYLLTCTESISLRGPPAEHPSIHPSRQSCIEVVIHLHITAIITHFCHIWNVQDWKIFKAAQYWGCTLCLFSTSITMRACTKPITQNVQCQARAILVNFNENIVRPAWSSSQLRTHVVIPEEGCCYCAVSQDPRLVKRFSHFRPHDIATGWWLTMLATSFTVFDMASM